jgi:hypothetical protein
VDFKDYYQTLGVSKTATAKEIKAAFRKLARKFHPDVNPGDAAGAGGGFARLGQPLAWARGSIRDGTGATVRRLCHPFRVGRVGRAYPGFRYAPPWAKSVSPLRGWRTR